MLTLADVSIIVPYRPTEGHRQSVANWTLHRLRKVFPECELILGLETDELPFFCRSQAINNGVHEATGTLILISDADVFVPREAIQRGVQYLNEDLDLQWVIPYELYVELSPDSSDYILRIWGEDDPFTHSMNHNVQFKGTEYANSNASLILIDREAFWAVNGFDERFQGWGPEDQAWAEAVTTLCGPHRRVHEHNLYHLWHPVAPGTTHDNPYYAASMRLWDAYKEAAGNSTRMAELVAGNHG